MSRPRVPSSAMPATPPFLSSITAPVIDPLLLAASAAVKALG